jgi:fibronectin type 3 domain-containing protein
VVGYRIYRHAAGEKAKVIAESKGAAESWMDSEAKRGTTYLYSMTAVDAAGSESSPSEPVAAYRR